MTSLILPGDEDWLDPREWVDPEEARREAAYAAAARVLEALPEDRADRLAMLASRADLFSAATLKVRTKDGGPLWPFVFNPIQLRYLEHLRKCYARRPGVDLFRGIRDLIVKPRQLGFSTLIAALFFMDGWLSPGRTTVVLTHVQKISIRLLRTYKTFFESLPPDLRRCIHEKSNSKYELEIEFLSEDGAPPSLFIIASEEGAEWRGDAIHNLHSSEPAFYRDWAKFKASYVQAVPMDGNVIYETTVNGYNHYYDAVQDALAKKSRDRVVFYPWFDHPEYVLPWDESQTPPSEDEQRVMRTYGLTLEQLAWRRWKRGEVKEKFAQEFPETLLGAFLSSGRPFFDLGAVDRGHEQAKAAPAPRVPRNGVQVWEDPLPGEVYLLSADIAEGKDRGEEGSDPEQGGADFSRAYVTHASSLRVVAAVGGRIRPVEFARMLDKVGRAYEACIAVERNNHGHSVLNTLEVAQYPEIYRHREYTEGGTKAFLAAGFPTNSTTRPMILDALDEVIRRDAYHNPDPRFWLEAHSFHRNSATGKPEAMSGKHDDRVMAGAIGAYLCTLGRGGWNAGLADGSDSAGFPRRRPAVLYVAPPLVVSAEPAEAPQSVRLIDTAEVADLLGGLRGRFVIDELAQKPTCGTCHHYGAPGCASGPCSGLFCLTDASAAGCDAHWPLEDAPEEDSGLGDGDEEWTLS